MTMDKRERVARAIAGIHTLHWDDMPDIRKSRFLAYADAALAEIGGVRDAGEGDDSTPVDVSDKTKTTYFDSVPAIEAEMKLHKGRE